MSDEKVEKTDERSEQMLAGLYPPFAEKLRQLTSSLDGNWRVDEGFRSFAEQDAYFEQGRSRPGALITRDRAGYSGHCYGTVAHLTPTVEGAAVRDNAAFLQLATEAANVGLLWGGTDTTGKFVEMSRVEIVILSIDECLALFKTGGLPKVWAAFDDRLGIVKEPVSIRWAEGKEKAAAVEAEQAKADAELEAAVQPTPPVLEINPQRATLQQGNAVELDKDTEIRVGEGSLIVPDDVAAELAEIEAEDDVEPEAVADEAEPKVPAKPDSPVVARKRRAAASKKR